MSSFDLKSASRLAVITALLARGGAALAQKTAGESAAKSAAETAKQIRDKTGTPAPTATKIPAGDPCALLPLTDVQRAFPGAKPGERSRRLEEIGTTECAWKLPNGRVALGVQESYSDGSTKDDLQDMAMGFTDPLRPQVQKNLRYESLPNVGSNAMAMIEQRDEKRGILGDAAMVSMRNGEHTVMLMSAELSGRDRTAALKTLEDLAKVAAKRLQ